MLDDKFCEFVEYKISDALTLSNEGFWCDGVLLPLNEGEYSQKTVNDKRELRMKAFVGKSGQEEYELLLRFGQKSLSRYARGLSIEDCFPETNWLTVDVTNKRLTIQLT